MNRVFAGAVHRRARRSLGQFRTPASARLQRAALRAAAAALAAMAASGSHAQTSAAPAGTGLPAKPIQFIVPNPPGGGPDFIARLIAPKLSESIRHNVIVENRSSANGIVGTEFAARGASDGSIVAFGNSGTHAINATLYRKLPYDPLRDFAAVTEVAAATLVLVSHPAVPAKSVRELVAIAKKSPGKLNIAIAGATGELAGNAIKLQAGIDMKNIPYKGGGPATIAVISGEADMTLTNYIAVARHVEAGKLRILGVTSAKRAAQIPNVPTIAENGLDGYEYELWYGMFVPSKVPPTVVQALYREVARIVDIPEVRERLVATGHSVVVSTPEQFTAKVRREVEKYRKLILATGMQQD